MFKFFKKEKKCEHKNTKEIFRYYPDNYVIDKCLDCGEEIYSDLFSFF